jgi:sterol desaturase/sphingolipid hydroxylase (fatty acid hydroxylase superfamily)
MEHALDPQLWSALLRRPDHSLRRRLLEVWTAAGLLSLLALAWAEPWSKMLPAPARLAVMALRGVLLVESFGYGYHRFFQHVGWLTRRSQTVRRNQMYHWMHHMVIYPIGRFYKRDTGYVAAETGLASSWTVPGFALAGLFALTHGANLGTAVFLAAVAAYAKLLVDETHSRFHLAKHPWARSPYFHRLEDIHLLHHWDQAKNFTIVHPAMDMLFGTYLSPAAHRAEIDAVVKEDALTVSDATNWRYLLKEASPAEHAAFITQARRHPRSVRKLEQLLAALDRRLAGRPAEVEALDLHARAMKLLRLVSPDAAASRR